MELKFEIQDQILRRLDKEKVVNKSRNVLKASFKFSSIWYDMEKFVIFRDDKHHVFKAHLGNSNGELTCIVPYPVLKGKYFSLSVYAGDLVTSNEVVVPLLKSGYTNDINFNRGYERDILNEIFETFNTKIDRITFADNSLHIFSNGRLIDSISLPYADDILLQELMQSFVKKDDLEATINSKLENYVSFDGISFIDGVLKFE